MHTSTTAAGIEQYQYGQGHSQSTSRSHSGASTPKKIQRKMWFCMCNGKKFKQFIPGCYILNTLANNGYMEARKPNAVNFAFLGSDEIHVYRNFDPSPDNPISEVAAKCMN